MRTDISVDSKQSHMTGVQFPVSDEGLAKLADLKEHKLSLVQLVSILYCHNFQSAPHKVKKKVKIKKPLQAVASTY